MTDEELLTVEQATERLGVSPATFWNLVKRYKLPKYKLPLQGKRVYFMPSDLDALRRPVRVQEPQAPKAAT
jgi:excisionase family DNA binding protein